MSDTTLTEADRLTDGLEALMRGRLVHRRDPDYDEVRALYNGMIDRRPLAIARCADTADVRTAVDWARTHGLRLAVRGGGHNGPGLGSVDDGLVIDLSALRDVVVDPVARTVRVGGGCTSGDVDRATAAHGLAVPFGIVSTTGVGGLTLGGGTGYLTRKHGLTIDNLLEAEVVLADGRVVTADAATNPDLFWALRGGGGNFGVVVSFLFRAHPVDRVLGGPVFWDIEHARTVMRAYADFLPGAPEELGAFVGLKTVPMVDPFPPEHQGRHACALVLCFNGPVEEGRRVLAGLLDRLPTPIVDWTDEMPYTAVQSMFDPLMPSGMQWYWRGDFVKDLTDEAIDAHLAAARELRPGARSLMHLYPVDGAVHRVGPHETAWNNREATWSMVIAGIDPDPAEAGTITAWVRRYWDTVHPFSHRGGYVNFMMDDEDPGRLGAAYGDNLDRLAAVKAVYDPENVFRVNHNIIPAGSGAQQPHGAGA